MATDDTVHIRVSRDRSQWGLTPLERLQELVSRIPQEARSGRINSGVILRRAGTIALDHIKKAFLQKSKGGTDEAGDRWQPLQPKTIAYRHSRTKVERSRDSRPSQALNKTQQTRWWDLYRQGLAMYQGDKARAAKRAWFILKSEGATTLFDKYSSSRADILYNTGELYNSITSSVEEGEIIISASHKAAAAHHYGVPGRLPQRRLWPEPNRWPDSWWSSIADGIRDGILENIKEELRGGGTL